MDRWEDKLAVVTGATSGIGLAVTIALLKAGMKVVGITRRVDRLEKIQKKIPESKVDNFRVLKCNVKNESEVKEMFEKIDTKYEGIHILINCAGVLRLGDLTDQTKMSRITKTMEINTMGVIYCTTAAYTSMKKRGIDGHVVIVNCLAGHVVPYIPTISMNAYSASKHALIALAEQYRQEFATNGTNIKITVSIRRNLLNS